jgi:PTS system N-acetylgalactosamine-specific IIB component
MSSIVLTRIDDRLIHGQIFLQWCAFLKADLVAAANDKAAASAFSQGLMDMAVPNEIQTRYWSISETIVRFSHMEKEYRIFLVVQSPEDLLALKQGGVPIENVNIGNLCMKEDRLQKTPSVAVSAKDVQALRKLQDLGCHLEVRRLPSSEPEDLAAIFR